MIRLGGDIVIWIKDSRNNRQWKQIYRGLVISMIRYDFKIFVFVIYKEKKDKVENFCREFEVVKQKEIVNFNM